MAPLAEVDAARRARRAGDYELVPTDAEAVLEVGLWRLQFRTSGFDEFTPYVYVTMWIARRSDRTNLGSAGYEYGPDDPKGNTRYWTAPANARFESLNRMTENSKAVAAALDEAFARIAQRMAEDVRDRMSGSELK
jgi:hypothetical protein